MEASRMASNIASNDGNVVAAMDEDGPKSRRSSRSIKRKKFDDELIESPNMRGAEKSSSTPKTQSVQPRSKKSKVTPTSGTTVHSIPEMFIANTEPSTSITKPQKLLSSRTFMNSSASKTFLSVPTTSKVSSSVNRNKSRKQNNVKYDFGQWKPTDDLMLIKSVMNTNDLQLVHTGVKFSRKFTLKEITRRWEALVYDPKISEPARSAMRYLYLETVNNIEFKALFSFAEEKLLATIQSVSQPTIKTFQKLLTKNRNIFHHRRTAEILMCQWQLMKKCSLLSDQYCVLENPVSTPLMSALEDRNMHIFNNEQKVTTLTSKQITTLAENKELFNDEQLLTKRLDAELKQHLSLIHLVINEEVKVLEDNYPKAQALVFPVTGTGPEKFDPQTLGMLRGRSVRYLMRSRKITIGRSSKLNEVDVDLRVEGPAWKISRRQATILMRDSGDFIIVCEGKRCLYVDGKLLTAGDLGRLNHNSVIKIASLRFIFLINHSLVNKIKQEIIQQNQLQLPKQIINQTPQKQHAIRKAQKTTMTKSKKLTQEKKLHEINTLVEQKKELLSELHKKFQQEHDELQKQLKFLEALETE